MPLPDSRPEAEPGEQVPAQETSFLEQMPGLHRWFDEKGRERIKECVAAFLRWVVRPGLVVSTDVETNIQSWIAEIDKNLSAQLNEIMHHPDFQRLEASWRGLHYLVHQSETGENLKIRVMNVGKRDLLTDLERATEFDQSALFGKIYEEPYRTPCGTPFGLLVGDYEFGRDSEDVFLLRRISNVAATSHAPFVAGASPKMFNFDRFTELTVPCDLTKIFSSVEYASWKSFRDSEDSRHVALTLPHVLARLPYGANGKRVEEFDFEEFADGEDHDNYAWMNAAWAYASRITDAFSRDGWMARTRGVEGGGKVEGLPLCTFPPDADGEAMKRSTEVVINERSEFEFSHLGFLPLLHLKNRGFAVFMGAQSCQKPKCFFDPAANFTAELSAKFDYTLCVSRFAHYLKVMARGKFGSFQEVGEGQRWLNDWIRTYVRSGPENAGEENLARFPLAEARVEIRALRGKSGWYEAVAWVLPNVEFETLTSPMRLVAELPPDASFLPAAIDPTWLSANSGAVMRIAQAIRKDRRCDDLPILADALEEAGCADERILGHCRDEAREHVHDGRLAAGGCWVVNAILG